MGTDPSAKLFFGYVNPEDAEGSESSWRDHDKWEPNAPCRIEIFGYEDFIRYAIAVTESVVRVDWSDSKALSADEITIGPDWISRLNEYVEQEGIDVSGLIPSWHLVSLYF